MEPKREKLYKEPRKGLDNSQTCSLHLLFRYVVTYLNKEGKHQRGGGQPTWMGKGVLKLPAPEGPPPSSLQSCGGGDRVEL